MRDYREYNVSGLEIHQIKLLLWEFLQKSSPSSVRNDEINIGFAGCVSGVCLLADKKGLIQSQPCAPTAYESVYNIGSNHRMVGEAVWELVRFGILIPDSRLGGNGLCFYVTDYGKTALSAECPIPHEPNSYLAHLKASVPDIDDIVLRYARESIFAYNNQLLLSATTSIGVASEKAILLLMDAFTHYLPAGGERESFISKTKGRFIKTQFEAFKKSFDGHKGSIEKDNKNIVDGTDTIIDGIFEILRKNRNDAGHPTGKELSKEEVFILLRLFITYVRKIYDLIEYFVERGQQNRI